MKKKQEERHISINELDTILRKEFGNSFVQVEGFYLNGERRELSCMEEFWLIGRNST